MPHLKPGRWDQALPGFSRLKRFLVRFAKGLSVAVATAAASIGLYCVALQYTGNFHVVAENKLYRSAQLDKASFERVIKDRAIRSILNLRHANPGEAWYDDEIAITSSLGVKHYDYGIGAREFVTRAQINDLLNIIRDAPKPQLIHCKAGADRAGLVSALYLAAIEGVQVDEAARQLSLTYGHFPYLTSKTGAMDQSYWAYVKAPRLSAPPRNNSENLPCRLCTPY